MDATADEYREALDAAHRHALEWLASTAERPIRPDLDAEAMLGRLRHELPEEGLDAAAVVEELAEASGLSVPQLQRLFHQYVGVTPKWVIKRFRLQEAAERIEQDASVPLAELAAELGYFDQAHFIRDFKSVLGQSPATYRKRGQG